MFVSNMHREIIKPTPFGSVGLIWTRLNDNPKVVRVLLSKPGLSAEDQVSELYPNSQASSCSQIDHIATAIKGLLEGEEIKFSLDIADLSRCSEFQQLVLGAEHRIPRGSVSTYQLIAKVLGKSNAAMAVGNALSPSHSVGPTSRRLPGRP